MNLAHYLGLLHRAEINLAAAYREVAAAHSDEPDVDDECRRLAGWCDRHVDQLQPASERYGEHAEDEPDRLHTRSSQAPEPADSGCCATSTTST